MGMNAYLPSSLRVLDLKIVSDDFHAQRSATHKRYSYFFQTGPAALPSLHHRVFWIKKDQPDVTLMQKAAQDLIGLHDFKVFCATDSSVKTTTRKVLCAEVTQRVLFGQYRLIQVQITATGFLKQMMRRIAGTLLDIGLQKKSPSVILHLLKSSKETPDYASLGRTAPGYGLWLERVFYPSGNWSENLKDHRPENYKEEHKEELRQEQQELQRQEQRKNQSAELNFFEQEDMNFPYFF
jgi:tRNA pseudouridine38-40 synthase